MKSKFLRRFLQIIVGILVVILMLLAISIRRLDRTFYRQTDYYKHTVAQLEKTLKLLPPPVHNQLLVGAAKAGFTPPAGIPLAGFGNRKGAPSTSVHDSLFVRSIVLQSGENLACIIGYDALICPPHIARVIEDSLRNRLGLRPGQILFTATHTHSGPGGWSNGWVEEQFAGPPDSRVPALFVDSTLVVVKRALHQIKPGSYGIGSVKAPSYIHNRLVGDEGEVDDELVYATFSSGRKNIAVFVTYSAHATVLSGRNFLFSGDYPGYLERKLESTLGGVVLFAAAAVGSGSPRGSGEEFERARNIGNALADSLLSHFPDARNPNCTLRVFRISAEKHDLQIHISENWRLAPWLARRFFHAEDSYLQVVSLDRFLVLGSPAEFSSELALKVKRHAQEKGMKVTVTSFNGCYIGYVTPSKYADLAEYETRLMSFFGPYTGDYLAELMNRIVDRIY